MTRTQEAKLRSLRADVAILNRKDPEGTDFETQYEIRGLEQEIWELKHAAMYG